MQTFQADAELMEIARKMMDLNARLPALEPSLRQLFAEEKCSWDATGLLELVVRLRGRLHHFNPRSPRPQPTPFEQHRFRSIALVTRAMATWAIGQRELTIQSQEPAQGEAASAAVS